MTLAPCQPCQQEKGNNNLSLSTNFPSAIINSSNGGNKNNFIRSLLLLLLKDLLKKQQSNIMDLTQLCDYSIYFFLKRGGAGWMGVQSPKSNYGCLGGWIGHWLRRQGELKLMERRLQFGKIHLVNQRNIFSNFDKYMLVAWVVAWMGHWWRRQSEL